MRPPECRLCGVAHWGRESHEVKGVRPRATIAVLSGGPARSRPARNAVTPVSVTRNAPAVTVVTVVTGCPACGAPRAAGRTYCSNVCRQRAYRKRASRT